MAWTTKALKAVFGKIVPQYFNVTADDWEPIEGADGAMNVSVTGSNVEIASVTGLVVNAGVSNVDVFGSDVDISEYKYIYANATHGENTIKDYRLWALRKNKLGERLDSLAGGEANSSFIEFAVSGASDPRRGRCSEQKIVLTPKVEVRVDNVSDTNLTFSVELYGIKI